MLFYYQICVMFPLFFTSFLIIIIILYIHSSSLQHTVNIYELIYSNNLLLNCSVNISDVASPNQKHRWEPLIITIIITTMWKVSLPSFGIVGREVAAITGLAAAPNCNTDTLWESDYHRERWRLQGTQAGPKAKALTLPLTSTPSIKNSVIL